MTDSQDSPIHGNQLHGGNLTGWWKSGASVLITRPCNINHQGVSRTVLTFQARTANRADSAGYGLITTGPRASHPRHTRYAA